MTKLVKVSEVERRIAEAKTPEDANRLRRQITALQKVLGLRKTEYAVAFDAATAYLKASIKAGELWKDTEKDPGGRPSKKPVTAVTGFETVKDVGFASREDARRCLRIYEAAEDDQLNTYLDECRQNNDLPTVFGFYKVWRQFVAGSGNTDMDDVPPGRFRCLVIDPPWPVAKIEREVRPNQDAALDYPTWTIEAIRDGDLKRVVAEKADEQCHLYLWTTHKYLPDAIDCAAAWGFDYQCLMTWVKNVGMTPYSWMYSTEHLIFATRGDLPLKRMGIRLDFQAKVREHSRKPDEFYEIVKEVSPEPRLELFGRESRPGFEAHGDEKTKFVAEAAS